MSIKTRLAKLEKQIGPIESEPQPILLSDEAKAVACANIYEQARRPMHLPSLTAEFLALPAAEQLRHWAEVRESGSWLPDTGSHEPALPCGLKELPGNSLGDNGDQGEGPLDHDVLPLY